MEMASALEDVWWASKESSAWSNMTTLATSRDIPLHWFVLGFQKSTMRCCRLSVELPLRYACHSFLAVIESTVVGVLI